MRNIYQIFFVIILLLSSRILPQSPNENWISIISDKDKIAYLNVTGLSSFQNDEIMFWVMEEMSSGLTIEEIPEDIYKVKSYYMISKSLKRYSLVDIIYYNEKGNVIKSYHYSHDYENQEFKYTSPIMSGSEMELIFTKCMQVINSSSTEQLQIK